MEITFEIGFNQVRQHFSIGCTGKTMAVGDQPAFQCEVVFDDAVVSDVNASRAVAMRMRVIFARPAVRCPSRMSNAALHRPARGTGAFYFFLESRNPADRSDDLGRTRVHDCKTTRVISAVL